MKITVHALYNKLCCLACFYVYHYLVTFFYGSKFKELLGWNLFYAILGQEINGGAQNLSALHRVSPSDTQKPSGDQSLDARNGEVFQVRGSRKQEQVTPLPENQEMPWKCTQGDRGAKISMRGIFPNSNTLGNKETPNQANKTLLYTQWLCIK